MQAFNLELTFRVEFGELPLKIIDDKRVNNFRRHVWNKSDGELA